MLRKTCRPAHLAIPIIMVLDPFALIHRTKSRRRWTVDTCYVGCIILESLDTCEPLRDLEPIARRVFNMPTDPDASTWDVCWFRLDEAALLARLPSLAAAMRPHWYAHFWRGDDLCVVLHGRIFWARCSDKDTWQDFIAYGEAVGLGRKWTENIPTRLPAWVQGSLAD